METRVLKRLSRIVLLSFLSICLPLSLSPCLLVPLSPCQPCEAAEVVEGLLSNIAGDVEVQKRGGETWVRAYDGIRIGPGDQISTGIDGRAVLTVGDSKTDISSLTQFVVGRSVKADDDRYTELFLRMGKVVSRVPKQSGVTNRFNVITPTAVVGVRGTEQTVGHFPGIGTQANIRDGKGFAAPVSAEALPAPVQGVLGITPSKLEGDGAGKKAEGDKKKKKKGAVSDEGEESDKEKGKSSEKGEKGGDDKKKKKEKGTLSDEGEETDKERGALREEGPAAAKDEAVAPADIGGIGRQEEAVPQEAYGGAPAQEEPAAMDFSQSVAEEVAPAADAGGPMTTEAAVDQFNQWLESFDLTVAPDAGIQDIGLLDDKTLEFVVPVDDGLRISVSDRESPEGFVDATSTQQADAQTDIAPVGLSPAEQQETATSIEAVDAPVSISVVEEQSSFEEAVETATQTSTQQGGIPPTGPLIIPPALPDISGF